MKKETKYKPVPAVIRWYRSLSKPMRTLFLNTTQTSEAMLRQWAAGRRGMSAEKAGVVEDAMVHMHQHETDIPTPVLKGDMCAACGECFYYKHFFTDDADNNEDTDNTTT